MRKKFTTVTLILLFCICAQLLFAGSVITASAAAKNANISFSLVSDTSEVKVGDHYTIKLTGKNIDDLYSYSAVITYDSSKARFILDESSSNFRGFDGTKEEDNSVKLIFSLLGATAMISGNQDLYTLTFEALTDSTASFTFKNIQVVDTSLDTFTMESGLTSVSVTQKKDSGSKPTATPKAEPTATAKPEPTATQKPEPTPTEKPEPTPTEKPKPTATKKPEPTATQKAEPTTTQKPEPTATMKPEPTVTQKPEPTKKETPENSSTTDNDSNGGTPDSDTSLNQPTEQPEPTLTNKPTPTTSTVKSTETLDEETSSGIFGIVSSSLKPFFIAMGALVLVLIIVAVIALIRKRR